MPSKYGNTLADKVVLNVLGFKHPEFKKCSFLDRGSDERQYCNPGVDLPVVSVMRTMYGEYAEYHTSLDNMSIVSPEGFGGSFEVLKECIEALELNRKYKLKCLGEPFLSKYGLYQGDTAKSVPSFIKNLTNIMAYLDGTNDIIDISNILHLPVHDILSFITKLKKAGLIS
jgi:aminopeptidase-like protein